MELFITNLNVAVITKKNDAIHKLPKTGFKANNINSTQINTKILYILAVIEKW